MVKALESLVSSAKSIGRKILKTAATIPFILGTCAGDSTKELPAASLYVYFTQGENIDGTGHVPPLKGMKKKYEGDDTRQTKGYRTTTEPLEAYQEIIVAVSKRKDQIRILASNEPREENIDDRTPILPQLYHETKDTNIYFIFPKEIEITGEIQKVVAVDTNGRKTRVAACRQENTKTSYALRKVNEVIDGVSNPAKGNPSQMKQTLDRAAEIIPGNAGMVTKQVENLITFGVEKSEENRIEALREQYGTRYIIHKLPKHIARGIGLGHAEVGRMTTIYMNTTNLLRPQKAFIEIVNLVYERNTNGITDRASLEGMVFETEIIPNGGNKTSGEFTLGELNAVGGGFSFTKGRLINTEKEGPKLLDIVYIAEQGIIANNKEHGGTTGLAGITDMGEKRLKDIPMAPMRDYVTRIPESDIREGHVYCVRTANGKNYGKMRIIELEGVGTGDDEGTIKFKWEYQPEKGTRTFESSKLKRE